MNNVNKTKVSFFPMKSMVQAMLLEILLFSLIIFPLKKINENTFNSPIFVYNSKYSGRTQHTAGQVTTTTFLRLSSPF